MSDTLTPALEAALGPLVALLVTAEVERRMPLRPEWMTLDEAADRYRTTAAALRKRAHRGTLPGAVRDGSRWLVDTRMLDASLLTGRSERPL